MKKLLAGLLAVILTMSLVACGESSGGNSASESSGASETSTSGDSGRTDDFNRTELLKKQSEKVLGKGESSEISVNTDIADKNYIELDIKSDGKIIGTFEYSDVNDPAKKNAEEFFIEPSEGTTEFRQFLDAFREGSRATYNKKFEKITFKNLEDKECKFEIIRLSVSDRKLPTKDTEIYIGSGDIKLGIDLSCGGSITYLERTDYDGNKLEEVIRDGNVVVDLEASANCDEKLSDKVNLINIADRGREIQQSYYAEVDEKNGYTRVECDTAGFMQKWPYNPVQGGDCHNNQSQIIDYRADENSIYVKVRALDWAQDNVTTKSYMENIYTIKDDMVYVDNRFVDWTGFYGEIGLHTNELPAVYIIQSFSNFVCYTGSSPWTNGELTIERSLGFWGSGAHTNNNHTEDWFAWVNANNFGVGVYVPNTGAYASGRVNQSVSSKYVGNSNAYQSAMYNDYLYNKAEPSSLYTNCYVSNTSYTAPVITTSMKEYVPMSYTYVLAVDYVSVMRNNFKALAASETIKNENIKAWA